MYCLSDGVGYMHDSSVGLSCTANPKLRETILAITACLDNKHLDPVKTEPQEH